MYIVNRLLIFPFVESRVSYGLICSCWEHFLNISSWKSKMWSSNEGRDVMKIISVCEVDRS